MRMWVYVVRRAALAVPVVIGVMTVLFVLISALPTSERTCSFYHPSGRTSPCSSTIQCPNDPAKTCPNPVYVSAVNALGLNKPIFVQWAIYIGNALTFNWGYVAQGSALGTGETGSGLPALAGLSVATVLAQFLPYTIELALLSLLFILIIAIPLGNLSAVYRNRPIDQASRIMSFSGFAIPTFLLGTLVLAVAAFSLGGPGARSTLCGGTSTIFLDFFGSWPTPPCSTLYGTANIGFNQFPNWLVGGYISTPTGFPTIDAAVHGLYWLSLDTILRMVLPALVIAYGTVALLLRFVRNSMLEVMNLDYIRTARAKGLPESKVIKKHAGRNSLNVTITVLGLTFAGFITGFPVIEIVFNLWGVGRIYAYSVIGNPKDWDFGILFGTTLLFTYLVVAANIIVDILYAYLDPRVRLG
jgi:ABC-type dipeptide/oligopeptide/nickel transport system permease component